MLEATDAFRKPERFEQILLTCIADLRGRSGHEHDPYPQQQIWQQLRYACSNIKVQNLIQQGFQGAQIKAELHAQRLQVIQTMQTNLDIGAG